MRAWLRSADVVRADGAVLSWTNPDHPGYPYPEAAGLLLSHLSLEASGDDPLRDRVARRLARETRPSGAVGRLDGVYLFDTAVVLSGTLAHLRASRTPRDCEEGRLASRMAEHLLAKLAERSGTGEVGEHDSGDRWSRSYGSHLLKCVIALKSWFDWCGDVRCVGAVEQLASDFVGLSEAGRFPVRAGACETYLHSHCYAVEGLLALESDNRGAHTSQLASCAAWLASVQCDDGGLPSFHDGEHAWGAAHADVAAQAIRIWSRVDRRAFRREIDRALDFLAMLQHPSGGLRYAARSEDVNVWATIFAVQAAEWADEGDGRRWTI